MRSFIISIFSLCLTSSIAYAEISPELVEVRADWAHIKYQLPQKERTAAYLKLAERSHAISEATPSSAEPLIWEAIILSSLAGEEGGLSALSKVKQAKKLLEQAEKIDPYSLDGSVYTSLGSLYYQVPGWPVGFGNDDKARQYLKKALVINPDGIDPNYFYGDYLMEQGNYQEAIAIFEKALNAPERPDRPAADTGRRQEIQAAIAKARQKL
jgi:tetratricopeptide (TPR) repeat protein